MTEKNESTATVHDHPTATAASLKDRLESAKARMRDARNKREARRLEREPNETVEVAERQALNEEAIEKAEEHYGEKKIKVIDTQLGCVIIRQPNALHYKRFRDKESAKSEDLERLVRGCLVHPTGDAFDRILDQEPGVLDVAGECVVALAGFRIGEVSKK